LGDTLRLAGTAEFSGLDDTLDRARIDTLWRFLEAACPRLAAVADRENATAWCGFRPMSADGLPFIGPTRIDGLYVNAGQGHLGWTQAAGSAALLARLVTGETSPLDSAAYSPLRI
jgi:D-amino-acid dehydrogenase